MTETSENYATVYKQVVQLRSDFQLEVAKAKQELGLGGSDFSCRVDLYSLSRVIDLILQYLLVHRFQNSERIRSDPILDAGDGLEETKSDSMQPLHLQVPACNADSVENLVNLQDASKVAHKNVATSSKGLVGVESEQTFLQMPCSELLSETLH